MKKNNKSLIYVNFSPYTNAGNILDFLLSKFSLVVVFCFNFYKLGPEQESSMITIYQHKKIIYRFPLFQTPTPRQLVFILLPLRSVVLFIQLFIHTYRLQKKYGTFDYFFTVNAFSAWCGNILRSSGWVKKTIFWVWDYYPPNHTDPMVRFMRWLYWQFDKPASLFSNRVIFLNRRIGQLRKSIGVLSPDAHIETIGIATAPKKIKPKRMSRALDLVFFGVIKKSHGLDLIIQASDQLYKKYSNLTVHIIGGGPDEEFYKKLTSTLKIHFVFHGYVKEDRDVDSLIRSCHIGVAPYTNDESNVSQYTDPSKIKRYLVNGLPVISTNVFEFSQTIESEKAGKIIDYSPRSFVKAVEDIKRKYMFYQKNALKLAENYSYKKIYDRFFED